MASMGMDPVAVMQMQMQMRQQAGNVTTAAATAAVSSGSSKKPRGKMTPYACFVKVIRAEHKKKHPTEHIVFAEFSKKCAEKWSQMNEKEKKRFQEMSLKDKERYEREMAEYEPPAGEAPKPKKKKRTKDPNAPKRALSAFMWFCKDARKDVKEASPELRMGEIAKVLSVKWKECPNREIYEKQADEDKQRYAEAMKVYKSQKATGKTKPMIVGNQQNHQIAAMIPQQQQQLHHKQQGGAESEESDESGSEDDDEDDECVAMMMQMPMNPMVAPGPAPGPPAGANKKPKGKMTPYACFVKVIRAEHKKKHPNEHIVFAEFSKKCAEKWSQMTDKEKRRFQEMSLNDKERYEREMAGYEPQPGEKPKRTKKKRTKDPNAPKRALSAFMWFCKDARKDVKEVSPELRMGEIAKVLSVKWKTCPNKEYYEKQSDEDKQRYANAMRIYKSQKAGKPLPATTIPPQQPTVMPMMAPMSQQLQPPPQPHHHLQPAKGPDESESESDESGSEDDDDDDEA
ncbi:uncharacterized protein LOC141906286 [Tubulanus polymorphus]|uniref:uncharacterized protein LOC141906286 n=1 Tax=Tubulanus polymorphus TaxID=672921 RepID=UPI003DA443E9